MQEVEAKKELTVEQKQAQRIAVLENELRKVGEKIPTNRKYKYGKIVAKLEQAFSIGCTVSEACLYAGIDRSTYYAWIKKNPTLSNKFEALMEMPILRARQTLVKALDTSPEVAFRYLERKKKDEFSPKVEVEHDAKKGSVFKVEITTDEDENKMETNKEAEPNVEVPKGS